MHFTIQRILNLSHTLNLNHNVIISMQHATTPHELYKHYIILIFTETLHNINIYMAQNMYILNRTILFSIKKS